ncbi:MAG TPA: 50S ribosomal protein L9, partial [Cryptosporangiaceae bacterium]|nr:50S ribosomal protein L9 [Cryptosporangiaceae bacterium]
QEVSGLGSPGDIVEVKDGYGRNYLLPQGKAMVATRGAEKQVAQITRARDARQIRDLGHATEVKNQVEKLTVRLETRAGQGGRLFGSVTAADIVDAVVKAGGPQLDRRRLELPGHIKTIGSHTVTVRLHPEVSASVSLDVVAAK